MLTAVESPVRIEVVACEPCPGVDGRWRVTILVGNRGSLPVVLSDAWLPHGRFRGDGHVALEVAILPSEAYVLMLGATAREDPGTVVHNAFLILRTDACRVFARMRVEFDAERKPRPVVEAVTAQFLT